MFNHIFMNNGAVVSFLSVGLRHSVTNLLACPVHKCVCAHATCMCWSNNENQFFISVQQKRETGGKIPGRFTNSRKWKVKQKKEQANHLHRNPSDKAERKSSSFQPAVDAPLQDGPPCTNSSFDSMLMGDNKAKPTDVPALA